MRRLLAYRDARLLVAGQSLSAFGDWAMWIVLAVWMKTLTGSSARAGLVFFALGLGNLAGPLGGLLADRVKRRPLMIVCDCVPRGVGSRTPLRERREHCVASLSRRVACTEWSARSSTRHARRFFA